MSPLDQLAQVAPVAAPEIQHGLSRLDSGEPQRGEDVLASKLLRSEPPRRLEKKAVFVCSALRALPVTSGAGSSCVAQKVPFSR
jgi:hypothetical protein